MENKAIIDLDEYEKLKKSESKRNDDLEKRVKILCDTVEELKKDKYIRLEIVNRDLGFTLIPAWQFWHTETEILKKELVGIKNAEKYKSTEQIESFIKSTISDKFLKLSVKIDTKITELEAIKGKWWYKLFSGKQA